MAYYHPTAPEHAHHALSAMVEELRPWMADIAAGIALLAFFAAAYWASASLAALIAL